ncbi:protein-disulfide reductase DsbD [Halopseudomonas salegens]|uniref:Thiol:disulfide interchange protein DsbD n=1 Tax=Halopseudomonas salegens TaxID=1434072 RepID=A0A1H2GHD7_9GAMM|nr:protein-disulfide reductase DsbD [Halopseudomonas salegens]SDU18912.1 thiol:disulfide interchange protein DsbD [Halopseudomonas salegens]
MLLLRVLLICILLLGASAQANPFSSDSDSGLSSPFSSGSSLQHDFLPVNEAFRPMLDEVDEQHISLYFDIAPGYYLYRHRFEFALTSGDEITRIDLPSGKAMHDEFFGDIEAYYDEVSVQLQHAVGTLPGGQLQVSFQGCADAGLCYPPETVLLDLPGAGGTDNTNSQANPAATASGAPDAGGASRFQSLLQGGQLGLALLLFFLAGLGLTFTPCVLPMLPILSSLVVGRDDIDRPRALILALSYVLAMAISFALVGALIGTFGAALNIQARLQSVWVLSIFALFFVAFALAMFGLFELRLPARLREPIEHLAGRTRGGSIPGAATMGVLSTLVVSPCISAPLAGALVYISATGNAMSGAATLFALALGMGLPLLLVAVFGNALLPRSGAWLETVKQLFGFGLLGVAIWLLERVLPGPVSLALWAALTAGLAVRLGLFDRTPKNAPGKIAQTLALLSAIYAAAALFGSLAGNSDPLRPLANLGTTSGSASSSVNTGFASVTDQAGLQAMLQQANEQQRPAIIELYADWCISCKQIERDILARPDIQQAMQGLVRIKLDMTANTPDQRAWLQQHQLFGPPAFLFFTPDGIEATELRIQGETDRTAFSARLEALAALN